jgi:LETM1 and EF-hand domain-containing protein 1
MASSSNRGLSLATNGLLASARASQQLRQSSKSSISSQADLLRLFAPHLRPYSTSGTASTTVAVASPRRRRSLTRGSAALIIKRYQHTQPQESGASSNPPPPPPSNSGSKTAKPKGRQNSSSSLYQTAGSNRLDANTPTSHISRVVPVMPTPASELGAEANQVSASQSMLVEKQEAALKAKEAAEKWKKKPLVKRAWIKIKEEAQHYWHGTKLLGKEVRISGRLVRRLMLGYNLTRREHRQLKRTTADLLRLIPFLPFIIVPFGELLLPVAIKIFPNMLPSTFESKFAVEEKRRGLIKVRLEMAKFLQGTIKEGGISPGDKVKTSDEFKEFFRKVRSTGEEPSPEDVIRVAKLFEDELTLDNLTRPQLVSMCRYMQINAFGTDNYLRYQIRTKLNRIRTDDMTINAEGTTPMTQHELQSACQNRGIQTYGLTDKQLREELKQWIDLHLHKRISGILLVLSKAFNYLPADQQGSAGSQLKSLELTLSSLPDNLINEAELEVSKDGATNKQRLEVLQQQEELIEDEAEQEEAEEEARRLEKEKKKDMQERVRLSREEEEARALLPRGETDPEAEDVRMTNEQLTELGEALSILSAKSSVLKEREELAQLIKEVSASYVDQDEVKVSAETSEAAKEVGEKEESKDQVAEAAQRISTSSSVSSSNRSLAKRVKSMLQTIDTQLEEYDRDVGSRMNIIEASSTGKISVDDLEQALRLIKHRPDEEILESLVDKLDVDNDGLVPLADLVELARQESGLGIMRDDHIKDIRAEGSALRDEQRKPRREDIVS